MKITSLISIFAAITSILTKFSTINKDDDVDNIYSAFLSNKDFLKFTKINLIGHGGFSKVYSALIKNTNKVVIIKNSLDYCEEKGLDPYLLREIIIHYHLSNRDNINKTIELIFHKRQLYLVIEAWYQDLSKVIKNKKLTDSEKKVL